MKKKNPWKLNNRGITLTELVVVIAITAVLAGGGITMMGLIPRMQVNGCVQDFVGNMNKVKTNTMSFQDVKAELYQDSTGVYMQVYKGKNASGDWLLDETSILIGEKGVCVKAVIDGAEVDLNGKRLELSYDRSSGSFNDAQVVGGVSGECTSITFYKGSIERVATLTTLTGKMSY